MRLFFRRHQIWLFFLLTLLLGWSPLFTARGGFMAFGMSIAGLIVVLAADGGKGALEVLRRSWRWRVAPVWYAAALFIPAAVYLLAIGLDVLTGGKAPGFYFFRHEWQMIPLLFFALIFPMEGPLGEEVFGLRGYALPKLQARFGPLWASLMVGAFFGAWHLPEFFRTGSSQAALGFGLFPLFILGEIGWSTMMTWVYNKTGGSVLVSGILFHAAFNFWVCTLLGQFSYKMVHAASLPKVNVKLFAIGFALTFLAGATLAAATRGRLGLAKDAGMGAALPEAERAPARA